jgi:hypothetical protein
MHDLSVLDDAERGTWHSKIIELLAHVAVDLIELRARLRWRRLGVPRRQGRQDGSQANDQRRYDQAGDSDAFRDRSPLELVGCYEDVRRARTR